MRKSVMAYVRMFFTPYWECPECRASGGRVLQFMVGMVMGAAMYLVGRHDGSRHGA